MCGIVGIYQFAGSLAGQKDWIVKLSRLMEHRGPDGEGLWSDERHCVLGFRRLAILDLSLTGNQPMLSADGRYALVYNGEVYNFENLRKILSERGFKFRSTGDTEVVLNALIFWGPKALEHFNGMFALAFYDKVKKELLLARDYAGIKPLYYLKSSQGILFASQYDQIFSHPWGRNLSISEEALALYLRLGYIPAPYGMCENTYMLEPGTWIKIDAEGHFSQNRYFAFPAQKNPELKGQAALDQLESSLRNAVKRHLISDVPVGTFLSGGIDSPLISALVKEVGNRKIKAFTLSVPDHEMDETEDAKRYAREMGLEQKICVFSKQEILQLFQEWINAASEPFADYSLFPTMLISREARKEVKVMLSGDGGDELFWGYAGRFASVLKISDYFREPVLLREARWAFKKVFHIGQVDWNIKWPTLGHWYRAKHSRIPEPVLQQWIPNAPEWPESFNAFDYEGWQKDETAYWLRWNEYQYHLTMVLLKVDRASMFHSLEVRVPFLDKEVIEIASKMDWRSCLDLEPPLGKKILRSLFAKRVSAPSMGKRGFEVPMRQWLQGPLRQSFEDLVLNASPFLGLKINHDELHKKFQNHLAGTEDYSRGFWLLLSLALWNQKFLQRTSL